MAFRLPNFFVVGAAKAGTTSLFFYLREHPEVYLSRIKEPNHFCTDLYVPITNRERLRLKLLSKSIVPYSQIQDSEEYAHLFDQVDRQKAIGECSVSYLYSRVAAREIRRALPGAKIIIVLRNPVERAFSHYLMQLRDGVASGSFRDELKRDRSAFDTSRLRNPYVEIGLYHGQVKRYLDEFPANQVRIYITEDLRHTDDFMGNLFEFLEVDPSFRPATVERYNQSTVPRSIFVNRFWTMAPLKRRIIGYLPMRTRALAERAYGTRKLPKLSAEDRKHLIDVFAPDVRKLEALIGRDLSDWLK